MTAKDSTGVMPNVALLFSDKAASLCTRLNLRDDCVGSAELLLLLLLASSPIAARILSLRLLGPESGTGSDARGALGASSARDKSGLLSIEAATGGERGGVEG